MTNVNEFMRSWLSHRKVLHQMLEEVSTEQLSLRPWEKAMSVSELAQHIAGAMGMFAETVKNGAFTPGAPAKEIATADELRAIVSAETEKAEATLRSLTEEQLSRSVDFFGRSVPGHTLLQEAKDHEIHHKGQLFVYLRQAGIEKLPFFVNHG
ncbi:DinB family protein [Cohnella lubricantis]|uniref:DinB family protein n=1 Tax=Cohnella lubricantis TaxID=2163172 RepID=A0A841T9X4_9BACL|nr:DinB family protein [Cohnella lubricantis]MBB6676060.1 DinB family protein [Cohnella lubricantis]MBP2118015.1 putative damage-inducible protein DinB [Cohnella lubricantis]